MNQLDTGKEYRHILILDSRDWLSECQTQFDPANDLVLTYDFGLKQEVESMGGQALYVDHIVSQQEMQENNFLMYRFFREWHLDAGGKDIFTYRHVPFGFSFRLEIWNDYVFYVRARICLEALRKIKFQTIFAGTELGLVEVILEEMALPYSCVRPSGKISRTAYYFPIHRWMDEKVRYRGLGGLKYRIRNLVTAMQASLMFWGDRWLGWSKGKPAIFVQEYHPTRKLVQRLQQDAKVKLVLASFSRNTGWFRYIPIWGNEKKYLENASTLMKDFRAKHCARLILSSGVDISESAYRIIDERISGRICGIMRTLDSAMNYMDKNPIQMEVLIGNIGKVATEVDCICKSRGIPSYLIINGMLGNDFLDESKYATVINSYSISIRDHYFRGMDNIVCLGDPRMDAYVQKAVHPRMINREAPTVTIGASGHNNTDLNSYLAVEFEFLYDVLEALRIVKKQDIHPRIVIKVRANGYRWQYEEFVKEYFPEIVDEILDTTPMGVILDKTDFFISIYSQTLFEASCLGIPCLYYKKDNEIIDPPFDGNSELVTVGTIDDLVDAIANFRSGDVRYDAFLQKPVMEKYIGPLDGGNLERNLNFIYEFLKQK